MRRAPSTRRRQRAFSLLELLVVMVVVATIAGIAAPRYARSLDRYRADAAARRVVADLRFAAAEARASSASRTVTFDTATDDYQIDGMATAYTVRLSDAPYSATLVSVVFDDPADPGDSTVAVVFDGYGRPDSGGTVIISSGSTTRTITLDPIAGPTID